MLLYPMKYPLLITCLTTMAAHAANVVLIDEDFTVGNAPNPGNVWTSGAVGVSNGQQWVYTGLDGTTLAAIGTEVWGAGGAAGRGLTTTYNHDQSGATAEIAVPGGFEVMSGFTSDGFPDTVRVGVQVTLPLLLDDNVNGLLTFFTENRISSSSGGNAPRYSIFNITDNRVILDLTAPNQPTGNWNFQNVAVDFIAADAGDVIEIRFQDSITAGADGGARGLQVADVNFSVTTVPEASTSMLAAMAAVGVALRRRRR